MQCSQLDVITFGARQAWVQILILPPTTHGMCVCVCVCKRQRERKTVSKFLISSEYHTSTKREHSASSPWREEKVTSMAPDPWQVHHVYATFLFLSLGRWRVYTSIASSPPVPCTLGWPSGGQGHWTPVSSSHSSWLTPASALCSRHRFWRKEVTPAQGLLCQPPWQAQTPESRGLHGARGSDATTLRLWVSQEESVLLQRGCSWLQGSRPAPCPEPTAKRQQEMLSFCIHCLLFTLLCAPPSEPHKGPSQASHPWPLASPFPLLQLISCPHYKHLLPFA